MRATRLLRAAVEKRAEHVLDIATGPGFHAVSFLANDSKVMGVDFGPAKIRHQNYRHFKGSWRELLEKDQGAFFDLIWCCHTLEHVRDPGSFLQALRTWTKEDGWLFISVPTNRQERLHIGHLTVWTPAHLCYHLVVNGWDCAGARWFTEYNTIGLMVQKIKDVDMSGRRAMPEEATWLQRYMPMKLIHWGTAWWPNNWHEETADKYDDPPQLTGGFRFSDLPPKVQMVTGPNPALRDIL